MTLDPAIVGAATRAANAWSPFWDEHEAEEVAIAILAAVTPLIEAKALANEREEIASQARRYAGYYLEGSDGRNTFVMLAEWIEARAQVDELDRHTLMGPPSDFD